MTRNSTDNPRIHAEQLQFLSYKYTLVKKKRQSNDGAYWGVIQMELEQEYGYLELHIEELLRERNISKNKLCKDLDIPRANLNRYCQQRFQRIDANLICKLCSYLCCDVSDLIQYHKPEN